MSNEATLIVRTGHPLNFTVADGTAIEKGSILKMTDLMTAIINSGAQDMVAGIASSEKIADDGKTKLGVYREGLFRVYLSGSCTTGDPLVTTASYVNFVTAVGNTDNISGSRILGTAFEDGINGHTVLMELKPSFGRGV